MGFWSALGKIALKVAPIAAAFIPGVGIPLAMAISGATNAASTKISGGSWKDALVSGGLGAATGAVGAGALGSIGPSSSALAKIGAGAAGKAAGNGVSGAVGSVLGNYGRTALTNAVSGSGGGDSGQPSGNNMASSNPSIFGRNNSTGTSNGQAVPRGSASGVMPRGGYNFQNNPMNQMNQNAPNLAQSIFQGRQQAMKDQPFRAGYDVKWPGTILPGAPAGTETPYTTTRMPTIQSDINYNQQRRRPRWNYAPPPPPSADMSGDSGG